MQPIDVTVNGTLRRSAAAAQESLLDWLRGQGLTGAKEGCAEGECGACAVLVARPDGPERTRWTAVNACLPPALAYDGGEIVTSEGLGTAGGRGAKPELHPVQREMADRGGSQCGYCTPGVIMTAKALLERNPAPSRDEIREATAGNLCRCTGYQQITDAIEDAAARLRDEKAL